MRPAELVLTDPARTHGDGQAQSTTADRRSARRNGDRASAGTNGSEADADFGELARLRASCRRHEHAIEALTQAVLRLRRGAAALKAENVELRAEIAAIHRCLAPASD